MKKMIIALCVLPFASHAMQDSLVVTLRAGEQVHMPLPESSGFIDPLIKETLNSKMQQFANLFEHPTFMSDLLVQYRDCLLSAPENIDRRTLMKSKISDLMAKQQEQQKSNYSFQDKKRTAQELAAAHCVNALLILQELK